MHWLRSSSTSLPPGGVRRPHRDPVAGDGRLRLAHRAAARRRRARGPLGVRRRPRAPRASLVAGFAGTTADVPPWAGPSVWLEPRARARCPAADGHVVAHRRRPGGADRARSPAACTARCATRSTRGWWRSPSARSSWCRRPGASPRSSCSSSASSSRCAWWRSPTSPVCTGPRSRAGARRAVGSCPLLGRA